MRKKAQNYVGLLIVLINNSPRQLEASITHRNLSHSHPHTFNPYTRLKELARLNGSVGFIKARASEARKLQQRRTA